MAEKEMKKICLDVRDKWKVENIAIYHRYDILIIIGLTLGFNYECQS